MPAPDLDRPRDRHPDPRPSAVSAGYERLRPRRAGRPDPRRHQEARPNPDGGGWRFHGRGSTQDLRAKIARNNAARAGAAGSRGYSYIHHAVDDHSRLAYSEIHTDERKETAVGYWRRACAFFAAHGITVRAVLTDNGACYRSKLWAKTLDATGIKHRRTRPYRPQTNGKVERFNRTLLEEWAYAQQYRSEAHRVATYPDWLHTYNHHRGHTALGGKSPADVVTNLRGQNN